MIEPRHLNSVAALIAAESTPLKKRLGEKDTEYVKRIVAAYFNALPQSEALNKLIADALEGKS